MNPTYRIIYRKFSTLPYKAQKKVWWGWKTVGESLYRDFVEMYLRSYIEELETHKDIFYYDVEGHRLS